MSVQVIIANADPHSRLFSSVVAEGYPSDDSLFPECSVMVVHKQEARRGIARHINVRPAVFIKVGSHNGHAVALVGLRDSRLLADVGKRPVAIISIKRMAACGQSAGPALDGNPLPIAVGVRSRNRRMLKGEAN